MAASALLFTALSEGTIKPHIPPRFVSTQTLEDAIAAALSGKTSSYVSSYFILVPASALDLLQHLFQCLFLIFSTCSVWPRFWPVLCSLFLLFLLSNAQPGLPGHTWIQCSFCSDFGCVTVAQCHRSQAWAQPCYKDWNNLLEHWTSRAGQGSQPGLCFPSSIWQPQTVIPPSPQLPFPWRWWCRGFLQWSFGLFPDLANSIPWYLSPMRTSAVSMEIVPAFIFIPQMSCKDEHWIY